MRINLHLHSQCSDGSLTISELAQKMMEKKYDVVALTDHDTVNGIIEMENICRTLGVGFIPGIEMTSFIPPELNMYDDTYKVHILGLGINIEKMQVFLDFHREQRIKYHSDILKKYGIEVMGIRDIELDNRVYCAELLVNHGCFHSIEESLSVFHCSEYLPEVKTVIEEIHASGGLAIWAHPFILPRNGDFKIEPDDVEQLAACFLEYRLDGMEGYYLQFSEREQKFISLLCKNKNLYCSTGTDYHADYDWEEDLLEIDGMMDSNLLGILLGKESLIRD